MVFNIADYIIAAVLALSAISGFKQGFFASLSRIASAVLAIGAVLYLGSDLILYLDNNYHIVDKLTGYWQQRIPALAMPGDSSLLTVIMPAQELSELSKQLTRFVVTPIAYISLFILTYILCNLLFIFLNHLVSGRFMGGINRISGMIILVAQSLLIMVIILGMAMPSLEFAAGLDIIGTVKLYACLQDSCLVSYLLGVFDQLKIISGQYA